MKEIGNLDENRLWQLCFPNMLNWCKNQGVYVMPTEQVLFNALKMGSRPANKEDEAAIRLELAMVSLWPLVQDVFVCDFFPHMLAAATDLLRAADFGENVSDQQADLASELAAALDSLENMLSWNIGLHAADQLSMEELAEQERFAPAPPLTEKDNANQPRKQPGKD